ncbi:MAG: glycoside hydrolase family 2 TIM barrel-domain containing protein [Bacillota bacterium]|nr:glycoside hydrolase family 2 TIM barrel-domain containing protein [Bacillota bacterium]
MTETVDLNGYWDWQLPGGQWEKKKVPGSYLCVGKAIYCKDFQIADCSGKKAFLCFDGIHYCGQVFLNDHLLGEMLPYVPYKFAVNDYLHRGGNKLRVIIDDITAHYGPTGGWEDYGGISRDVYLEITDALRIEDWQWQTNHTENFSSCNCRVKVWLASDYVNPDAVNVSLKLFLSGARVYEAEKSLARIPAQEPVVFDFSAARPVLWSCDLPVLYDLVIRVADKAYSDEQTTSVGFRSFTAEGTRFLLNGKDIFLKGVARHEMWGDDLGFALSKEQIEQDLKLIKQMGGNYVRLVHYPHHRHTIETADRLGLLVSEEPGLWWNDLSDPVVTGKAIEIMKKTVIRDRNSPSVICWLLFNECNLTGAVDYLSRCREQIEKLDDTRLISAANAIEANEAKAVFDEAGLDFYTIHPYDYETKSIITNLEILRGKPVVFTEWGGWLIHNNQNLLKAFKKVIARYSHQREPEPNLCGLAWWQWQDVYQLSRGIPACEDGVLSDGLVDRFRNRKPMFSIMAEFFDLIDIPLDNGFMIEDYSCPADLGYKTRALDMRPLLTQQDEASRQETIRSAPRFAKTRLNTRRNYIGPILPEARQTLGDLTVDIPCGEPIILNNARPSVQIPVGEKADFLHFIGQTTYFDGYPLRGESGEIVAKYVIRYENGSRQDVQLHNGLELASASLLAINSRIDPRAVKCRRLAKITIDPDFEVYQVCELKVAVRNDLLIESIEFTLINNDYWPLLYGISVSSKN